MSVLYNKLIRPLLFDVDPERAHEMTLRALEVGLKNKTARRAAKRLYGSAEFVGLKRFGLDFSNPLGIAAGFDKNGVAVDQLAALGFGFVEAGTATFNPQPGNEKPRLFRLPADKALINRLGFNNDGIRKVVTRLASASHNCIIGINIGKNRDVRIEDAAENYVNSFELAREVADYIAINVSSPNTPGLRNLQTRKYLEELISALQTANSDGDRRVPLLIKIAPDVSDHELEDICDISLQYNVSGIIATNTTVTRDGLRSSNKLKSEAGGLSGRPLFRRSNEVISAIYRHTNGQLPIIGVGGIFNGRDAFEKILAGASLIQAYTGFVYHGPSFARSVNAGLLRTLNENGFNSIDEAVGTGNS